MKILFLDIDGVLNSHSSATYWYYKTIMSNKPFIRIEHELDPMCVTNLEELFRRVPELKVVISSTWRIGETTASLKVLFKDLIPGLSARIIDRTISDPKDGPRGYEIQVWLDENPKVERYLILDDDSDMLEHQKPFFLKTSNRNGFTFTDMCKAEQLLK